MKTFGHFSLFCSIVVCIVFTFLYLIEPTPIASTSDWSPVFTQPPAYPADPVALASAALKVTDPFQPRFFATAKFKGITRNSSGGFSAIFLDGSNRIVQLAPRDSLGGITVVDATPSKCRVMVGSVTRELTVKAP